MSPAKELQPNDPSRVRGFANYFKNYMSLWPVVTAALPIPVTLAGFIPTYNAQTKVLSMYATLFCFLLLGFIFYSRHQLARWMFLNYLGGSIDKTAPPPRVNKEPNRDFMITDVSWPLGQARKVAKKLVLSGVIIAVLYVIYRLVLPLIPILLKNIGADPSFLFLALHLQNVLFWSTIVVTALGVASYLVVLTHRISWRNVTQVGVRIIPWLPVMLILFCLLSVSFYHGLLAKSVAVKKKAILDLAKIEIVAEFQELLSGGDPDKVKLGKIFDLTMAKLEKRRAQLDPCPGEHKTYTDCVLKTTDQSEIPYRWNLMILYLGIFLTAESAFILMALKEYLQDLIGISELELLGTRKRVS